VADWWEDWRREVDRLLDDPELVETVYQALLARHPNSRTRGRLGTPAEVVLRLLVLKHLRQWSYAVLVREVSANLVYRQFTRIGWQKVPHRKTIGKLGLLLGPCVVEQLHKRLVKRARAEKVIRGQKLRVDTTVDVATLCYTSLSL
jgi:IS5 family transposase